ncbi:MAG: hypothetical protein E7422_08130 [Ruminococcaceae bacterium]|nr:hypothetical protein [Oscillospiraceae bacterium]
MYDSKMKSRETDHLFEAILSLESVEECYRFFDDLCTYSEILAMSQRYQVAEELFAGKTFTQISKGIGASSTTITRVNRCMNYGAGGYKTALERCAGKRGEDQEG